MILAWALKRGFLTAKASRPDMYRAANHILRLALDGRINLYLRPPGFTAAKGTLFSPMSFLHSDRIFLQNDTFPILVHSILNNKFNRLLINKNDLIVVYPVVMIVKHFQPVMIIN